ncbi:MAG: hypothetical protein CL917_05990 [Deltaproteobacteria bacterium]|nr:hypothetical protein [Deltaproteobacteria bacterium]
MPIRAVVFDLFDTLVDLLGEEMPRTEYQGRMIPSSFLSLHALTAEYGEISFDAFLSTMRELEKQFLESHYAQQKELPTTERFTTLARRLELEDDRLISALVDTHMDGLREHVRVLDHHEDVLSLLKERVRLGLCSNFSHTPAAQKVLDQANLSDLFDVVVISDAAGMRKPHSEIFRITLDSLELDPDEVLHVGDSLKADVAGAAALGIRTVWITRRIADPVTALAEYTGPRPDFQIADLSELVSILDDLETAK